MAVVFEDNYGHRTIAGAPNLTAGAVSTTAVGTIAPTTAAGASPTVTITAGNCNDTRGRFTLSPVTGGGAQAAGAVAVVTFSNSYSIAPATVVCTIIDDAGAAAVAASATSITSAGFSFAVGAALTTAHTYTCQYVITP